MTQLGNLGATLVVALAVLTVARGTAAAAPSRPPTAEEKKAFTDGLRAYDSGDARGAEKAWKAGYAVARDPAFLVRIGEAQEKAGAPKEALRTYEQYLRESPDAADHVDILARVQRLAPDGRARAPLEVETPGELGGSSGDAAAPGPTAAPADKGTGSTPDTKPNVNTGSTAAGTAGGRSPTDASGASTAGPGARTQARDENEDLTPIMEEPSSRSAVNITAWVGAATTGALLGVAAFFGASASERAGDANRLLLYFDKDSGIPQEYAPHAHQFEEDVRLGQRDDRLAKVFLIAAGATAIASVALFIVDARAEKPAARVASVRADRRQPREPGLNVRLRLAPAGLAWSF